MTVSRLNTYLMLNIPSAWLCGVRIKSIGERSCQVGVKHRWINQNPFKSLYFAVQAMAAELSTGALIMKQVKQSGKSISMLVISSESYFHKKASGTIVFSCEEGEKVKEAVERSIVSGEGQTFWLESNGRNQEGVEVSTFLFEWTIRIKK